MAYTREQRKIQNEIIRIGRKRGMPRKAILSALATGAVESNFRNLNYGDRDSKGWRQERAMYYDNPTNIRASVNRYYDEWKADAPKSGPIGPMAQAVQQSAFPGRYQERAGEARRILRGRGGGGRAASLDAEAADLMTAMSIPGVDRSAERDALRMQYLHNRHQPGALLSLGLGMKELEDIPGVDMLKRSGLEAIEAPDPSNPGRKRIITATGRSVQRMLQMAEGWDRKKVPYLWGGGHGRIAKVGEQVDCSGFVSAVLGVDTPMVSGQLANWGKPGKGRWVSVYANDGHVLMSIKDPKSKKVRWFGTSASNPGGGAGEIAKPSASYLSQFTVRHP
jgi:hypothetical protein